MNISFDEQVFYCEFTILDAKGRKGKVGFYNLHNERSQRAGPADVQAFIQLTAQRLDKFITGQIIGISARLITPLPETGLKAAPLANSDIEEGALFHWKTHNNSSVRMRVPTFDEAHLNPPSPEVWDFIILFTNQEIDNFNEYPSSRHVRADNDSSEHIVLFEGLTKSFKP